MTAEHSRLEEARNRKVPWKKWGYIKYLYKYLQAAYPYDDIVATNRHRSRHEAEYELIDTGAFDDDRYFDVFVEHAKASPEDILIEITVCNRGAESATLHVLPTLWFRNVWSWDGDQRPLTANFGMTMDHRPFPSPPPLSIPITPTVRNTRSSSARFIRCHCMSCTITMPQIVNRMMATA